MLARGRYHVTVTRTGRSPSFLSAPDRVDHVEIVSLDDNEVVLFWDIPGRATRRIEGMLRADLDTLDAREFLERWAAFDPATDLPA